uniref:interleukin-6 receptor subunit beta-like n=1 Tax=Myxine glutinosa TaxID=7769 RepID=UPI00358F0AA1
MLLHQDEAYIRHRTVGRLLSVLLKQSFGKGYAGLEAPRDVSAKSAGNSALNVSWDAPSPTTCCHLEFVLAWAGCEWKGRPQGWLRVGPKIRSCLVPGLEPMRCYKVSVHASYYVGESEAASVSEFSQEGVPLMAPKITSLEPGKTWLFLSWHSLPMDAARGHVLQYIVKTHTQPPDKYEGKAQTEKVKGDATNAEILGLQPGTKYSVSVLAMTKAGQGPHSPEQVFITPLYAHGELQVQVVIPCLLVLLFISCGVTILHRRGRLKQHLWPAIPDLENTTLRIFLESQATQSLSKHQAMARTTNESLSVSAVVEVPFLNLVQPLCTSAPALDNLCQGSEMDEDHKEPCDPLDSYQDHGGPTWNEIMNEQQVDNENDFEVSLNECHKESYENESRLDIDAPYESNMESGNEPTELPSTMPSDSRHDGPLTEPCSSPDVRHRTSQIPSTWDSDYERQIFAKSLEMGSTGIISKVPLIHSDKAKLQPGEVYPSLQHLDMEQKTIDAAEPISTDFSFLLALK